jgi:hypothetical protein
LNGARDVLGDAASGRALRADLASSQLAAASQGQPAQGGIRGLVWLNPNAFAIPAAYTPGNSARTLPGVRGPGSVTFDSMLAKNFNYGERWRVQFRWELFNTFNTPQFELPAQDVGGGNFGVVTGAGGRRIMQFGLKLYW